MKKTDVIRYNATVTFGRFNIPHSGHVQLIQLMLDFGDEAHVYVSDGKNNNDWDLRVLLLRQLCLEAGIDLQRVYFLKASNPFHAVQWAVGSTLWNEAAVVLGSDQQEMARKLGDVYDCPVIINRRTNSSTQMRFFIDVEDFMQDLVHLYNGNEFATALAMLLRAEELQREQSNRADQQDSRVDRESANP